MITKKYDKSQRSGEAMRKINSIRFDSVPEQDIDLSAGEYYFHDNRCRKAKVLPYTEHFRVSERVYVDKDGESYIITYSPYTTRTGEMRFKPVMTIGNGEYGRIVYNEREATFDSEWYYIRTTINLYSADISAFRPKIFFRKEPDHLYEDMAYLRYCGDYHKA